MATTLHILEVIDIGLLPNDGTGDPLRVAFDKINNNFASIPLLNQGGPNGALQFNNAGLSGGIANLVLDVELNQVNIDTNIIPITSNVVEIGSDQKRVANVWLSKTDSLHIGNVGVSENFNVLSFYQNSNRFVATDLQVGNIYATGDLFAIGNVTSTGSMEVNGGIGLNGGITINSSNVTTQTNTANQVIYELPQGTFSTIRFQISSSAIDTNDSQTATITVTKRNDGIRAQHNVFGTVFVGNAVTRYNVDIAYGNLRLMVSPIPNIPMVHLFSYQSDKEV
jgi:hypothetical protein